jgi:hypothetical protein
VLFAVTARVGARERNSTPFGTRSVAIYVSYENGGGRCGLTSKVDVSASRLVWSIVVPN